MRGTEEAAQSFIILTPYLIHGLLSIKSLILLFPAIILFLRQNELITAPILFHFPSSIPFFLGGKPPCPTCGLIINSKPSVGKDDEEKWVGKADDDGKRSRKSALSVKTGNTFIL